MLNIRNLNRLDVSAIDISTLAPEERDAVLREGVRRAYAARTEMIRRLAGRLRSWWRGGKQRQEPPWSRPPSAGLPFDHSELGLTPEHIAVLRDPQAQRAN